MLYLDGELNESSLVTLMADIEAASFLLPFPLFGARFARVYLRNLVVFLVSICYLSMISASMFLFL